MIDSQELPIPYPERLSDHPYDIRILFYLYPYNHSDPFTPSVSSSLASLSMLFAVRW